MVKHLFLLKIMIQFIYSDINISFWRTDMSKKTIGVIPLIDYEKNSYWMIPGYLNGLMDSGAFPIILPVIKSETELEKIMDICDGFLFTGGQDVEPKIYHSKKSDLCGETCPERDHMEKLILDAAIMYNKPILGICRGIQFINAVLGGSLWQNIPSQFSDKVIHRQKPPYDKPSHDVKIKTNSPLYQLLKKEIILVNSYHHQGIRRLSPKLEVMAEAPDGLIEAVYAPKCKFLWAVQWHPEFSYIKDENSKMIFKIFAESC